MSAHPGSDLVPYLRDELAPGERQRVATHLEACAECRRAVDETRDVLARLTSAVPAPPEIHWGRYRAQIRARLQPSPRPRWWRRPLPVAVSAALATALVLVAIEIDVQRVPRNGDLAAVEEVAIGTRLQMLEQYPVIERLDLLEDMDVIRHLDRVAAASNG